jgi:hypothetical protein
VPFYHSVTLRKYLHFDGQAFHFIESNQVVSKAIVQIICLCIQEFEKQLFLFAVLCYFKCFFKKYNFQHIYMGILKNLVITLFQCNQTAVLYPPHINF